MMAYDNKYEGNYDEFSSFIEDVYKNCKMEGVAPSIIPALVKDLFDFYGTFPNNKNKSPFSQTVTMMPIMMVSTRMKTGIPNRS